MVDIIFLLRYTGKPTLGKSLDFHFVRQKCNLVAQMIIAQKVKKLRYVRLFSYKGYIGNQKIKRFSTGTMAMILISNLIKILFMCMFLRHIVLSSSPFIVYHCRILFSFFANLWAK